MLYLHLDNANIAILRKGSLMINPRNVVMLGISTVVAGIGLTAFSPDVEILKTIKEEEIVAIHRLGFVLIFAGFYYTLFYPKVLERLKKKK